MTQTYLTQRSNFPKLNRKLTTLSVQAPTLYDSPESMKSANQLIMSNPQQQQQIGNRHVTFRGACLIESIQESQSIQLSSSQKPWMQKLSLRRLESLGMKDIQESIAGQYEEFKMQISELQSQNEYLSNKLLNFCSIQESIKLQLSTYEQKINSTQHQNQKLKFQNIKISQQLRQSQIHLNLKESQLKVLNNKLKNLNKSAIMNQQSLSMKAKIHKLTEQLQMATQNLNITKLAFAKQKQKLNNDFQLAKKNGQKQIDWLLVQIKSKQQQNKQLRKKIKQSKVANSIILSENNQQSQKKYVSKLDLSISKLDQRYLKRFRTFSELIDRTILANQNSQNQHNQTQRINTARSARQNSERCQTRKN